VSAGQRLRKPRAEASDLPARVAAPNPAIEIFVWSRVSISALFLGVAIVQWALWRWVA
jgi:hypothetical protein